MKKVFRALLAVGILFVLSWAVTAAIVKAVCFCFGIPFSFKAATGIWIILSAADYMIHRVKNNM